jgi:hypothetical protein
MINSRRREKFGISKIVGEARMKSGDVQSAYLALRQLLCARCGKVINTGDYFTRKTLSVSPIPISPRCQDCAPFELHIADENKRAATKEKSGLLESLLEGDKQKSDASSTKETDEEIEEKFLSRLGPALEKTRRNRFNKGS